MSSKTRLTVRQHYHGLFTFLRRHAHLWWSIGLELGFLPNELSIIQSNPILLTQNPPVSYVSKMLELWLQWAPGDGQGSRTFATFEDLREALLRVDGIAADALDDLHKVLVQPPEEQLPPVVHSTPQSPLDAATLPQPNTESQVPLIDAEKQLIEDKDTYYNDEQHDLILNSNTLPLVSSDEKSDLNLESTASPSNDQPRDVDDVQSVPSERSHEASLQDKLDELEHQYRMITFNFDQSLKSTELDKLQSYAASLPIRVQKCYEELKTDPLSTKTKSATCASEFVGILNKFSNFMNPALLGDAVKMFGDEKTKSEMNVYNSKLQEFQVAAKLEHFVNVAWEGVTPEEYEEIELVLKSDWRKKTLKDISPPKRYWLFKKVFEGSLKIIFSLPDLKDLEEDDVREFLQKHVEEVRVNGECYLRFDTISGQTAPEESETVEEIFTSPDEIAFRFSSLSHGKNVIVSEDGLEARRRDVREARGGCVYIPTLLSGRVEFEVEVTDYDSSRYGLLEIGVGQTPRGSYRHLDIPQGHMHLYCYWDGDAVTSKLGGDEVVSPYGSVDLYDLECGDRVGVQVSFEGDLSFSFNGISQGVAARKYIYREDHDTFLYVDVNSSTTAVRIARAAMSGYEHSVEGHKGQVNQLEGTTSTSTIQFKFHPVTGKNIMLLEDGLLARRIDPGYNSTYAVVYGSIPITYRGTFEVETVESGSEWTLNIQIGVMRLPTGTELKKSYVPVYSIHGVNHCVWQRNQVWNRLDGDLTRSDYGSVNLKNLQKGDKVGMRLSSDGTLSYFVNGRSQGVAARGLNEDGYDIYPVVDVNGQCCAVRITRAETCSEVLDLQELCIEKIASCLDWSPKDVNLLPLPQRLKNQIEHCIDHL